MQWVDYTVIVRVCMFPIDEFARIARHQRRVGITLGVLWMLQDDTVIRDESATGQFYMQPDLSSLYRNGGMTAPAAPSATVMTFWRSETNGPFDGCPRTTLQTMANKLQSEYNLNILCGFEIEVIFLKPNKDERTGQTTTIPQQRPPSPGRK